MIKFLIAIAFFLVTFHDIKAQNEKLISAKFETTINKPAKILKVGEGHYFIDFGKAFFGTLRIESKVNQKDSLTIHLAEELQKENTLNRKPKGTIRYQKTILPSLNIGRTDIVLPPNKRNTTGRAIKLPDSFRVVIPFRYCEIENLKVPIDKIKISQKAFHYLFNDNASHFFSSDKILNQIWDLCKHTIKATSFAGYYIDGDRERIPYEADAYINQLSHYSMDSEYSLAKRTNKYFIDHPSWPTEWVLHTAKLFYYDYLYSGDKELLYKYYDKLKAKTLMELAREDGLITTNSPKLNDELMIQLGFENPRSMTFTQGKIKDIVDWPKTERDDYEFKDINTVVNSFYYENLQMMSLISEAIGKKKDSKFYKKEAELLKKVINEKLFDSSKGIYLDGEHSNHSSLHANMFPLAFDLVPEENITTVINFIKSKGMVCSVYGAQYLLEGLYKNKEATYAKKLIVDTSNVRTWWNMIKSGSTITLESWDIKLKPNIDWNHAWGTAPANLITRYMWGIKPKSPGYADTEISPQLDDINFSEITVPTIRGLIYAKFKKSDDKNEVFEIKLPKAISGNFKVPYERYKSLVLNGKTIKNNKIIKLKKGLNIIKINH